MITNQMNMPNSWVKAKKSSFSILSSLFIFRFFTESIGAADSTTDDKAEGAASNNLFGNRVNSFSFSSLAEVSEGLAEW